MLQYHRCSINESLVIDVIHDELLVDVDVLVSQKTLMKAIITWAFTSNSPSGKRGFEQSVVPQYQKNVEVEYLVVKSSWPTIHHWAVFFGLALWFSVSSRQGITHLRVNLRSHHLAIHWLTIPCVCSSKSLTPKWCKRNESSQIFKVSKWYTNLWRKSSAFSPCLKIFTVLFL